MFKLIVGIVIVLLSFLSKNICAQTIKMTVAQAGVNPGTSLYFIAQKKIFLPSMALKSKSSTQQRPPRCRLCSAAA